MSWGRLDLASQTRVEKPALSCTRAGRPDPVQMASSWALEGISKSLETWAWWSALSGTDQWTLSLRLESW